jgi:GH35 family endo-1,4-beta-xylanase
MHHIIKKWLLALISIGCLVLLTACGGGSDNSSPATEPVASYTISGQISGLQTTVNLTLQVNGAARESLEITQNGSFTFNSPLASNDSYTISLTAADDNQQCAIENASGHIGQTHISNISINCSTQSSIINVGFTGEILGLEQQAITLTLNNNDSLTFNRNQNFYFSAQMPINSNYQISISDKPDSLTCSLNNASGTIHSADVGPIEVSCYESVPRCSLANTSIASASTDLSGNNISGIEPLVEKIECGSESWRQAANERIAAHRQTTRPVKLISKNGQVLANQPFETQLVRHQFKFGGAVRAKSMFDTQLKLNLDYTDIFEGIGFNKAGFENALKYKQRANQGKYIQPALDWFSERNIPVRGHTLFWPKWSALETSVKLLAGDHPNLNAYQGRELQDLSALELQDYARLVIANWAQRWQVVEWDVANELRANTVVQDIINRDLGIERSTTEADWFNLANSNSLNNARLFINDFQMISDTVSGSPTDKMLSYSAIIDDIIADGGPIEGIGFQSRFGADTSAEDIYNRLQWFAAKYPNMPFQATEFEIKGEAGKITDEYQGASIAERALTIYFSHPSVTDIIVWTIVEKESNNLNRHIINLDGSPNLRGKIWLYLTKKHWHTQIIGQLSSQGDYLLTGYKGTYKITTYIDGEKQQGEFELIDGIGEISIQLQ